MVKIARTAGRVTGRAVGRLIVARRQLDDILGQSAATQVTFGLGDWPFSTHVFDFFGVDAVNLHWSACMMRPD